MRMPVESIIAINDLSQCWDGTPFTPANLPRQKLPISVAGLIMLATPDHALPKARSSFRRRDLSPTRHCRPVADQT